MSRYLIVIESTATGYSAYSPDLPGCVVTGRTRKEVEKEMHDAIEFHIEGLRLAGELVPKDNMGWSGWEKFRNLTPNDKTNLQEQE
jgi:predicted RNase H-like HicB family nuclease